MSRANILIVPTLAAASLLGAMAANAQDRYGPAAGDAVSAPAAGPSQPRFLSWPGKAASSAASAPAQAPAQLPAASSAPADQPAYRTLAGYRTAPPSTGAANGWRPVYAAQTQAPQAPAPVQAALPSLAGQPQPAPASIYAPPRPRLVAPVQSAPLQTAQVAPRPPANPAQGDERVHFYSLHRQYGLQPDPAPIPPQFFSNTADLSEPPGPIPAQRLVSGGASTAPTRVVQATGGSDSTSNQ